MTQPEWDSLFELREAFYRLRDDAMDREMWDLAVAYSDSVVRMGVELFEGSTSE